MDLSKLNVKPASVLKIAGVVVLALILLTIVSRVVGPTMSFLPGRSASVRGSMGSSEMASYGYDAAAPSGKMAADSYQTAGMPTLSTRNVIAPMPPATGGGTGNRAEEFEVKQYYGTIETRTKTETCSTIASWKAKPYVIFESANESDRSCDYMFKVEKTRVEEVLAQVKALNPKDLSENVQSIKRQVDDFTSEVDILTKKQASIEKTLDDAVRAYDEITVLATRTQDAASLARIIESKIQIIERLTQERINVNEQLDRLARAKAEQLDRMEYTYFQLSVYENKFVDGENLKDSWKAAVREFVQDVNRIAQDLTVGLVALFFFAIQWLIYFFIVLVIVKYVWKFTKAIWKS